MRTANITLAKEGTSGLSSGNKATSIPLVTKTKYPFPYNAGIFGIAAKRYKPTQAGNIAEPLSDRGINLAY